jgi:hypothetical protein
MKFNGGGSPWVNWFQKQMTINILDNRIVMFGSLF